MRSKHFSKRLAAAIAVVAAMAMLAPAANAATPAPGYEDFAGCMSPSENPKSEVCLRSVISSGHFQMGSKDVPITTPIILSGGTDGNLQNFSATSKGGLSASKQKVPGGVVGLTGLTWLLELFGSEALTLYAVTELAGSPHLGETEFSLPIRVHLVNPLLGSKCYVGSFTNPIQLNLITGTTNPPPPNKPITGKEATFSVDEELGIIHFDNGTFVDNSFAAPGANGCVLTLFGFIPISINGLVNSQSGLPAPAGTNETVQNFGLEIVPSNVVYP